MARNSSTRSRGSSLSTRFAANTKSRRSPARIVTVARVVAVNQEWEIGKEVLQAARGKPPISKPQHCTLAREVE